MLYPSFQKELATYTPTRQRKKKKTAELTTLRETAIQLIKSQNRKQIQDVVSKIKKKHGNQGGAIDRVRCSNGSRGSDFYLEAE